jgi:alkaline phosphatase D
MKKMFDCALKGKNDKHYFFSGKHVARFSSPRSHVHGLDSGYPQLISERWPQGKSDSGFEKLAIAMEKAGWDSFDAAYYNSKKKKYYFIKGQEYMVYSSGQGVKENKYPAKLIDKWPTLLDGFSVSETEKVPDACVVRNSKIYFFFGAEYRTVAIGDSTDISDVMYIKDLTNIIGATPSEALTKFLASTPPLIGACQSTNNDIYLFKKDDFIRFNVKTGEISGEPGSSEAVSYPISSEYIWKGLGAFKELTAFTLGTFHATNYLTGELTHGPTFSFRQFEATTITIEEKKIKLVELYWTPSNPNYPGITRWFQLQKMDSGTTKEVTLLSNGQPIKTFTVTAPPNLEEVVDYSFTMGSCFDDARHLLNKSDVLEEIINDKPKFMIWNGDTFYYWGKTSKLGSKPSTSVDACKKGSMINLHRQYLRAYTTRAQPSLAKMVEQIPSLSTWDDHDFGWNNANYNSLTKGTNYLYGSMEVFKACWPNNYEDRASLFHTFSYGSVDYFVPDVRSFRKKEDKNSILGSEQMDKLLYKMTKSMAKLKVVVLASLLLSDRYTGDSGDNETFFYQAGGNKPDGERMRLMNAFTGGKIDFGTAAGKTISGRVLILSGDVHFSELSSYTNEETKQSLVEVTSSPLLLKDNGHHGKFKSNTHRVWAAEKQDAYALLNLKFDKKGEPNVIIQLKNDAGEIMNLENSEVKNEAAWPQMKASAVWDTKGELSEWEG